LPLKWARCYNFAARRGRFCGYRHPTSTDDGKRVHDPIATGRRAATRAVAIQAAAALLVALVALVAAGPRQGLSAAMGGIAMLAGNGLAVAVALGGGIQPAGAAFARLLLGTLGKWVVALAVIVVALGPLRLPPLPLLAGLAAGMLAYLLALMNERRQR
jgi:F0F1-type ATP synthase assembly protein I